jgi:hypothetical protein
MRVNRAQVITRPRRGNINAISSRHCSHSNGECRISLWFW